MNHDFFKSKYILGFFFTGQYSLLDGLLAAVIFLVMVEFGLSVAILSIATVVVLYLQILVANVDIHDKGCSMSGRTGGINKDGSIWRDRWNNTELHCLAMSPQLNDQIVIEWV